MFKKCSVKIILHAVFVLCSNDLLSESSSTVTLLLHTDWMIVKKVSNQGGANSMTASPWHTKSQLRMLIASKFLKNYSTVSTWIFNGSSIECHEKKHQPFSLYGVRF